ncbi:hypothetical protein SSX86_031565 [Deinandra increscens subsp. villosa]|uniref:F-box domain-containing protein n=1 Tax=Deinandra increscens subsp. villosa TaxID=3103831 RepID=A0AAP0C454_9ASTR
MNFTKTENNKKRPVNIVEGNRIGNLPEHLIDLIFERLPIQDVIRTSVLSQKWRYKWITMKSVIFDEQISKKLGEYGALGTRGFIRVINHVLLLHKGSIDKFYLYIPNIYLDSFQEVDQWMLLLSTNGIKDITLINSIRRYQLPLCLFSCLELRKLELYKCIFKPPLKFEGFLYLESLILRNTEFTSDLGGNMINVPQLKKLFVRSCTNIYNLKIKATKLQILHVINCNDVMLPDLLHSQCLDTVHITLKKPIKDFSRLNWTHLELILPKVRWFVINGYFLEVFIAERPNLFQHRVISLKSLWLYDFSLGDLDHVLGVLCLLRNSPNLEMLCLRHIHMESKSMHYDVETTSNHLESPDCLDQTLNRLQTVHISHLQGSRPELLFIKLLLANSPSLEKFTIEFNAASDANKWSNIAKDVMQYPRASSKAELVYYHPKSLVILSQPTCYNG